MCHSRDDRCRFREASAEYPANRSEGRRRIGKTNGTQQRRRYTARRARAMYQANWSGGAIGGRTKSVLAVRGTLGRGAHQRSEDLR